MHNDSRRETGLRGTYSAPNSAARKQRESLDEAGNDGAEQNGSAPGVTRR